ncbi:MAG TPA: GGDEF domain-containing protein [Vicinamibacterales bacterium]|nr:GGDEF domain-containing protein [Vicinamibacterales bacterium]
MRVMGRNDAVLMVGLTVALFVIFSGPVAQLLDYVREIEETRGLHLLPALVILATIFSFHQLRKRQEIRTESLTVARAAQEATERAAEMSRLVAFGHALARTMDSESSDSIRAVLNAHIPLLAPGRGAWVMTRTRTGHWEAQAAVGEAAAGERERAARRALGEADPVVGPTPVEVCFPMIIAGTPEGVLGVAPEPPLTDHQRSVLSAAAALLAVSLKNSELFREVRENSVRDGLTGCFNRTHALEVLDAELRRARRSRLPLSLVMFDLDNFKGINDRHGHLCGDAVLAAVGAKMKAELRGSDLKCRYGGDEFMVILPDTPIAGARQVSENLRRAIAEHPVAWNDAQVLVTASFGLTAINQGEHDPLGAISRADTALYRAKQLGRNVIELEEQPPVLV